MVEQRELEVEVRSWPERSDVLVIDRNSTTVLAQYALADPEDPFAGDGPLFDPAAPYEERSRAALEALSADQFYLQRHVGGEEPVQLRRDDSRRERIAELLGEYGIRIKQLDLGSGLDVSQLEELSADHLYRLLCDWHDIAERYYPRGSSLEDETSWVHRASPERRCHFHHLSDGSEQWSDSEDAYQLFRTLIDVDLSDFNFGVYLRWVYFHRTEFAGHERFPLRALEQLRERAGA